LIAKPWDLYPAACGVTAKHSLSINTPPLGAGSLISLIKDAGLHSAICAGKGKPAARFDRKNPKHIEFVQRYAGLASARVRYILEQELGGTYAVENSAESCSLSAFC
jgi:hypothetical protein